MDKYNLNFILITNLLFSNLGGWVLITKVRTKLSRNIKLENYLEKDPKQLGKLKLNQPFALSSSGIATLNNSLNISQIRIYCKKTVPGRTFHMATALNSEGYAALDFVLGKRKRTVNVCTAIIRFNDDNSKVASPNECTRVVWGYSGIDFKGSEPYIFIAWIPGSVHVSLAYTSINGNRYECDDYATTSRTEEGIWEYYVR